MTQLVVFEDQHFVGLLPFTYWRATYELRCGADTLLEKFRSYHQHFFIVRDARGKNIGIITMEDVLEELFGEIYDEKDAKF